MNTTIAKSNYCKNLNILANSEFVSCKNVRLLSMNNWKKVLREQGEDELLTTEVWTSNHKGSRDYSQLLISLNSIKFGKKEISILLHQQAQEKENLKIRDPVDLSGGHDNLSYMSNYMFKEKIVIFSSLL